MKTKRKSIFVALILTLGLTFGCSQPETKETPCTPKVISQDILVTERPAMAYKGGEKLTFIRHPQGDTVILTSSKLDSFYVQISPAQPEAPCATITQGQYFKIRFTGSIGIDSYIVDVTIAKNSMTSNFSGFTAYLRNEKIGGSITGESYVFPTGNVLNSSLLKTDTFQGKVYTSVLKITLTNPPTSNAFLYYSQESGILHFDRQDGQYLELLKKE